MPISWLAGFVILLPAMLINFAKFVYRSSFARSLRVHSTWKLYKYHNQRYIMLLWMCSCISKDIYMDILCTSARGMSSLCCSVSDLSVCSMCIAVMGLLQATQLPNQFHSDSEQIPNEWEEHFYSMNEEELYSPRPTDDQRRRRRHTTWKAIMPHTSVCWWIRLTQRISGRYTPLSVAIKMHPI